LGAGGTRVQAALGYRLHCCLYLAVNEIGFAISCKSFVAQAGSQSRLAPVAINSIKNPITTYNKIKYNPTMKFTHGRGPFMRSSGDG